MKENSLRMHQLKSGRVTRCSNLRLGKVHCEQVSVFCKDTARTSWDTVFIWQSWGMFEVADKQILEAHIVLKSSLKRYPPTLPRLFGAAMAYTGSSPTIYTDEISCREFFDMPIAQPYARAYIAKLGCV